MNWQEIQEKYPKALVKLQTNLDLQDYTKFKIYKSHVDMFHGYKCDWERFNERNLYDFFDENGIIVTIILTTDTDVYNYFDWEIDYANSCKVSDVEYKSRTEAETEAFIKAFELLNNKLGETE